MLLDETGMPLSCKVMFELWDVLSILCHALLHIYIGPDHAWPILAVVCGVSALDRDLDIHEIVAAIYVLRFSCHTIILDTYIAYIPCLLVAAISAYAHLEAYMVLQHTLRRGTLFATVIPAVMIRYTWNSSPAVSILRLVLYTLLTRRARTLLKQDSWDVAVQCMAVLCVPLYLLAIPIAWPCLVTVSQWYNSPDGRQYPSQRRVRMNEGILEEV